MQIKVQIFICTFRSMYNGPKGTKKNCQNMEYGNVEYNVYGLFNVINHIVIMKSSYYYSFIYFL